jgi:hypothetical protein
VISLNNMIEIHKHLLEVAVEAYRSLPVEIETYAAMLSSLPKEMVKLRLIVVEGLIKAYENALRVQHDGKGYIIFQDGNNMLSIYWLELDILQGKKEKASSGQSVFITPGVVLNKIEELISQVDSGELLPAVNWLGRHENVNIENASSLP